MIPRSPKIRKKTKLLNEEFNRELDPNKEDNFPTSDKVRQRFFDHLNPSYYVAEYDIKRVRNRFIVDFVTKKQFCNFKSI